MLKDVAKRITIADVLKEFELAEMGMTISVDGEPVDTFRKTMAFYRDSGMKETPEYKAIQEKYRGKIIAKDQTLGKQFQKEIVNFKINYLNQKMDEYNESLSK